MENNKELLRKLRDEIKGKFCTVEECKPECKKINHIMIIDDDELSNYVTRKTLECYNIVNKTTVFDSPVEALNFLKNSNTQPDIILLDIKMPVMNGFQFIEEFKKLDSSSVIYILSSSVYSKDKDKAKESGIKYMSKPLKANTFQKFLD
jgi:CheY-like chemotaxis protein